LEGEKSGATIESITYHRIMPAKQLSTNKKHGMHPRRKMYFTLLSAQDRFLNFSANKGNSATNKKQKSSMKRKRNMALKRPLTKKAC
jgi:hypothetical protein